MLTTETENSAVGIETIQRKTIRRHFVDLLLIVLGIFSAAFGFKGFLLTNHFIDGGVTGISLLVSAVTGWPFALLIFIINIPFMALAYQVNGRQFAIKTALAISGLSLCLATVPFPDVTDDNLLVAVFGGIFLGTGIGLSVRGGAVIDGTEVLAVYLSRKLKTTMNKIIATLPQVLPNSYVISSKGCPAAFDHLHFLAEGYRIFGRRYGIKMLSLLGYDVSELNDSK